MQCYDKDILAAPETEGLYVWTLFLPLDETKRGFDGLRACPQLARRSLLGDFDQGDDADDAHAGFDDPTRLCTEAPVPGEPPQDEMSIEQPASR